MSAVRLVVYSDYLCPWCYNAAVRLHRLENEKAGLVEVEWRAFLLRPRPEPGRTLEKFRDYTKSWMRPAADVDAGSFRVWQTDAGPPSHSIPPHVFAKAASTLGDDAFRRAHDALLRAYFFDNRDITDRQTLRTIWDECGLPAGDFDRCDDPEILRRVVGEHNEALEHGATGVPAVRVDGSDGIIVGAHPYDLYDRWVERLVGAA